jgi:glycosyltransferase involved in cell wall biosynthesis
MIVTDPAAQPPKVLRVLLLSTSYPSDASDWRGVFMRHLVAALARRRDVQLAVWAPPGELPATATSIASPRESAWLMRLMAAGGISHLMRGGGVRTLLAPLKLLHMIGNAYRRHRAVDVYHINWLQCALPLPRDGKPSLITVLGNDLKLLRLPFMRGLLRRVMRGRKVAVCPNAEWMQAPLQAAFGDVAEVIPVSFGIDPRWYSIERTLEDAPSPRWLAVTRLTADKLGPLFEWSQDLFRHGDRELHLFGPMQEGVAVPDWVHYHGAAAPEQLATKWFPSACGLITLSRHAEGMPQVMLEAMAAGLPIIASRMPAHAGVVDDGRTGILCDSAQGYGTALARLEEPGTNRSFGEAARVWAVREIGSWDDCAERYTRIYRKLLENDSVE